MFDFVKHFLGLDKEDVQEDIKATRTSAQAVSHLDIQAEIVTHQDWKIRLKRYLDGQSPETFSPEVVCADNRCNLGKWIHGQGREAMGKFPGFTALMRHHQMFHYIASNIVALDAAGQKVEARHMLNTQLQEYSDAVIKDLDTLSAVIEYAAKHPKH